jgi:hypothetical protein
MQLTAVISTNDSHRFKIEQLTDSRSTNDELLVQISQVTEHNDIFNCNFEQRQPQKQQQQQQEHSNKSDMLCINMMICGGCC